MEEKDPMGRAIWDYHLGKQPEDVIVESDILADDPFPIDYLFRTYDDFSSLEKSAMKMCKGKILDVGAGAGPHSKYLIEKGFEVSTIESSPNTHRYLKKALPQANHYFGEILDFNAKTFDTILLLMNGIGIAGTAKQVPSFLEHLAQLLNDGGSIICESTDVFDIYTHEDGSFWLDLNSNYYGDFKFSMKYKDIKGDWFDWVYVDLKKLDKFANAAGLHLTLLDTYEDSFLVQLKKEK